MKISGKKLEAKIYQLIHLYDNQLSFLAFHLVSSYIINVQLKNMPEISHLRKF